MAAPTPAKKAPAKRAPRPPAKTIVDLVGEFSPSQEARSRAKVMFDLAVGVPTAPMDLAPAKQSLPMTVGLVQKPSIGLIGSPNGGGGTLYAGGNPNIAEEAATASNGFGVRMAGRLFFQWFDQPFKTSTSNDTVQFNAGHDLCISVSNFAQSGFTYNLGAAGTYDTAINAMFTRMKTLLNFNAPVTGGSTYGGYTRKTIRFDIEHEVDSNAKAGLYGSTAANAPSEFQAFWKHFVILAEAAGVRANLTMCLIFTTTGFDVGRVSKWFMPDSGGHVWVDEVGSDMYLGFSSTWHWSGSLPTFASANASTLKWARQWGKPFCYPEFDVCESGNDTQMENFFIDMVNQLNLITDLPCTGIFGFTQTSKQEQNWNKVASEDTLTHTAHLGKHNGMARLIAMGGNVIIGGPTPTNPDPPTGITVTSSVDGTSETINWATPPAGVVTIDAYLQKVTDSFPHKLNISGPLNVTPTAYSFSTTPGTTYTGVTLVAVDASGNRSGFAPLVGPFTTQVQGPGNQAPTIVSASPVPDAANPLLWHFPVTATDPDGDALTITWTLTDPATGTVTTLHDSIASGGTSTIDVNFTTPGSRLYDLIVSDPSGAPAEQSGTIAIVIASSFTDHYQWRMLQHAEDLRQMAFIEQSVKPSMDSLVWSANHRRSPWNARGKMVGSNYDPGAQAGSTVVTPVAKDLWFTTIVMDAEVIAHLRTITARAQIGTGALGGFFDPDLGTIYPDVPAFSIDTWLQQAIGVIDGDTPQAITNYTPGDRAIFGMWWPATGITQFPQFRVRSAGGVQAFVPSAGISAWGSYANLSAFPASLDLTAAIVQPEIFIGVPEP